MTPQAALERGLGELALPMPGGAQEQLLRYVALLEKWNKTYNLTAVRKPLDMVTHHLLDSLAVLPHLPLQAGGRLADVGAGAGLPGIPLAIARPDWQVVMNDSNEKKAAFMRQAAIELRLSNLEVHAGRVEAWRPQRPFEVVISRAFAELADFLSACRHLLVPNGVLAAMKGARVEAELKRVPQECACGAPISLRVPLLDEQRFLVLCRER